MPIYKANGKKEGLQKYHVRINYISEYGTKKQITRSIYGEEAARDLHRQLEYQIKTKHETPIKRITIRQLFEEYISSKKYEVRESTLDKSNRMLRRYVLPNLGNVQIDKLSVKILQEWKMSIEELTLSIKTKKNIFTELRTMMNYAVRLEYIPKHNLSKVRDFKDAYAFRKKIMFYTPVEFRRFIDAAKSIALEKELNENNLYEWNYYVFFNIAFYTGLRKGEIHALRWSDIKEDFLSVERSLNQK
jgi:integrase